MAAVDCKSDIKRSIEQDDFEFSHYCIEDSEKYFAQIVGCIENIIISDKFVRVQTMFLDKYWTEFVEDEENRLIYTDIFKSYLGTVEKYIEEELSKNVPDFSMESFEKELEKRTSELDGEIFEMLSTFWNFDTFKKMFLEYKNMKEGNTVDFSQDILVTKYELKNDLK